MCPQIDLVRRRLAGIERFELCRVGQEVNGLRSELEIEGQLLVLVGRLLVDSQGQLRRQRGGFWGGLLLIRQARTGGGLGLVCRHGSILEIVESRCSVSRTLYHSMGGMRREGREKGRDVCSRAF